MRVWRVVLQVLVSLVITASVVPAILVSVPAARDEAVGPGLMAGVLGVTLLVVWLVWPRLRARK